MIKPKKNPRDINQLAAKIVALSTGQIEEKDEPEIEFTPEQQKAYARAFAQKGGLVGGKARAKALPKAKRVEIAQKAARTRWNKKK